MITPQRRWLTLVALACCLAMLLSHGSTLRTAPEFPGKDASVDELVQFYNEVQQYLNSVSRPRYGKRASSQILCRDPGTRVDC